MRVSYWVGMAVSWSLAVAGLRAEVFTEQKVSAQGPSYNFGSINAVEGRTAVTWHATNRFAGSSETIVMERGAAGWGIKSVTNAQETGIPFVVNGGEIIYQDARALNVYRREEGEWKKVQALEVGEEILDFWGLVANGNRMAALGRYRQPGSLNLVSKLFIFKKTDGVWKKEHEIFEEPPHTFQALAMASEFLDQRLMAVVQSNNAEEPWHLRIYRFHYDGSTNLVQGRIPAPTALKDALTGTQIAIDGQWAMVGNGRVDNGFGAVYMYRLEGVDPESWELRQVIRPNVTMFDQFGSSIALSGDKLLVGAPARNERRHNAGAAFLFEVGWDGGPNPQFSERRKFVASDGEPGDRFGQWVSFSNDTYVIGAPGPNHEEGGAIYFFEELPEVKVKWEANRKLRVSWPAKHRKSRLLMSTELGGQWLPVNFPSWGESGHWVMDIPPDLPAAFFRVQREPGD